MEITAREISRLLELNKKRAEFEFKRRVYGTEDAESKAVSQNASEISSKISAAGIEIMIPCLKKLDELGKTLDEFPPDSVREAMKVRDGRVYEILRERGFIVKRNFENRLEIAKISILASGLGAKERQELSAAVSSGALAGPIGLSPLDENAANSLARCLRRCGISCESVSGELRAAEQEGAREVRLEVSNRQVWISEEGKKLLEENLKKIHAINTVIQLRNAERQIRTFSDEEEAGFAGLQKEYLDLLKQQDEILRQFNDEEKLSLKTSG
ncbi:MAG: hypothetical protein U0R44_03135 [Candidatus Micrarchaeia archaeon]